MSETPEAAQKLLDESHPTVEALQQLVPNSVVAGGSFAGWLPHPATLTSPSRPAVFEHVQNRAVTLCVRALLRRAGFPETVQVPHDEGGAREWPSGFIGSLTHKGTVVLGAIAPVQATALLGIDLERIDESDLSRIGTLIAPEGIPSGFDSDLGLLLAFSAKEAVFKAQYPTVHKRLDFSDVRLAWIKRDGRHLVADVLDSPLRLEAHCLVMERWVVSAAFCK